jgi:hypothetical protein
MKTLTIRVSDEEHALMVAAAAKRFMSITGMVRAHFHSICEQDGTLPVKPVVAEPIKPQITPQQKPIAPKPIQPAPIEGTLPNPWAHLPEPNLDD